MKQSIRALGWATKILWIATVAFMATSLYSPLKLLLEGQIQPGSPQVSFSNGTIAMSIPFFINNTGFYDISALKVSTSVADQNGRLISTSTTFVENIPRGESVNETHVMSISLDGIVSKNLTYLFFNDTTCNLNASVGLNIAHVIPLQVSTNTTWNWGAPLYNLSIGKVSFPDLCNSTHCNTTVWLGFENHADFSVDGAIRLEIFNEGDEYVGFGSSSVNAPSKSEYDKMVTIYIPLDNLSKITDTGKVHAYFESPLVSLEWEFAYG